jgi:hypothetical protein
MSEIGVRGLNSRSGKSGEIGVGEIGKSGKSVSDTSIPDLTAVFTQLDTLLVGRRTFDTMVGRRVTMPVREPR